MRTTAIIPAMNEAATIGRIVETARTSRHVDDVVVVVDAPSRDDTAAVAEKAGATVLSVDERGKGEAMAAGVAATDAEVILFLDADLIGLRVDHVDRLVRSVIEGGAVMSCGLFDRGRWQNVIFLHLLPILTGERALRRELFTALAPEEVRGYRIEAALNARAAETGEPVEAFVCDGMWHRTKEEKFGNPVIGFARKVGMLTTAMWSYVSYWLRRHVVRRVRQEGQATR